MMDIVVGAITGYKWNQIRYWANSLDRSGFTGKKVVIAYNVDYATLDQLTKRNYHILAFQKDDVNGRVTYPNPNFSIVVDRFLHYYLLLQNMADVRYVIATDVRDVIFQTDPSTYLTKNCNFDLILSSESIRYQDEAWGANNLLRSFGPLMYDQHKTQPIVNCGVLAGRYDLFLGLAKTIYLMSVGTVQHVPGGGGPDQAALNLIVSTPAYKDRARICTHTHSWAAQLGTTLDPTKVYTPHLLDPLPVWDSASNQVVNGIGVPYAIVHQWDRNPTIRPVIERIYAS
jgi:hypothetical protein